MCVGVCVCRQVVLADSTHMGVDHTRFVQLYSAVNTENVVHLIFVGEVQLGTDHGHLQFIVDEATHTQNKELNTLSTVYD